MEERIEQLIAFTGTSREQALTCLQGASYILNLSMPLVAPLNWVRVCLQQREGTCRLPPT